jgi:hypothetical protein
LTFRKQAGWREAFGGFTPEGRRVFRNAFHEPGLAGKGRKPSFTLEAVLEIGKTFEKQMDHPG